MAVRRATSKPRTGQTASADDRFKAAVLRRLNVMIGLAMYRDGTMPSMTDRIHLLAECGLTPAEIADVVGKGVNYVGAVLGRRKPKRGTE